MAGSGALVMLGLSLNCYIIGMVGILVGMTGNAWFVSDVIFDTKAGLINHCTKSVCTQRNTLFKFEDPAFLGEEMDVVLSLLIACALFCFIAFIISLVMFCHQRRKTAWRCSAISSFIFGLISALIGLAALGYSESKFKPHWEAGSHGWSNILCWVGCATIVLASALTVILVCVTPVSGGRVKNIGVHYVGNRNPTYQHDYHTNY